MKLLFPVGTKIRLGAENIDIFYETLKADVTFLKNQNIMDYSLLLGIHQGNRRPPSRRRSSGVVLSSVSDSFPLGPSLDSAIPLSSLIPLRDPRCVCHTQTKHPRPVLLSVELRLIARLASRRDSAARWSTTTLFGARQVGTWWWARRMEK
jgi:hypothetical protein